MTGTHTHPDDAAPEHVLVGVEALAYMARVAQIVADHGFAIHAEPPTADRHGYSHTVGLAHRGWAELLVSNLEPGTAGALLVVTVEQLRARDHGAEPGTLLHIDGLSVPLWVHGPVDPGLVPLAGDVIAGPVTVVQVLWPDTAENFPNESGYDAAQFPQSVLPLAAEVTG